MNEIICPNCKKAFKVDEAGFADILKQVRDHQFEEELEGRLKFYENEKKSAVELAEIEKGVQHTLGHKASISSKLHSDSRVSNERFMRAASGTGRETPGRCPQASGCAAWRNWGVRQAAPNRPPRVPGFRWRRFRYRRNSART